MRAELTRAELEQVRAALWHGQGCTWGYFNVCNCGATEAREIIDRELAEPERLEWRVRYTEFGLNCYSPRNYQSREEADKVAASYRNDADCSHVFVEQRAAATGTPAGEWRKP